MTHTLHTEIFGQGTSVTLLHGWGMNSQVWPKAVLLQLPVKWILVDLPGHGKSSHIPLSSDINVVLEQLNEIIPKDTLLIGWSLGGMFALALAQQKARGRRLGLISSSPQFIQSKNWQYATSAKTLATFSESLQKNARLTIKRFIALQFMNVPDAKAQIITIQKRILNNHTLDTASLQTGLHYLQTLNLRANCASLNQPVVGFYGKLDNLVPHRAINATENCFAPSQFTTIVAPKAGHAPFLSEPELFKQFLLHLINE
jgi:pimeloyl-[acyl-carrier protein] methyl ester esterase